jgi:hypothetical protein
MYFASSRLSAETLVFRNHLMSLKNVKPEDERQAEVIYPDGKRQVITVTADNCFNSWDGYWSNFRLADYVGQFFPSATSCCFVSANPAFKLYASV